MPGRPARGIPWPVPTIVSRATIPPLDLVPIAAEYLAEGTSGGESTGLGLSIAQRTAELAGGHIAMGRQGEWMVVELVLPTSNV